VHFISWRWPQHASVPKHVLATSKTWNAPRQVQKPLKITTITYLTYNYYTTAIQLAYTYYTTSSKVSQVHYLIMNPRLGFTVSSSAASLWQLLRSRGVATPLPMRNHAVARAGIECEPNGVTSQICMPACKSPVNLRELFEGVRGSCLASMWKMERRPEFSEEKTSYELVRDKRVAELAKKLLPVTKAVAEL
jgi:hypothetical protein